MAATQRRQQSVQPVRHVKFHGRNVIIVVRRRRHHRQHWALLVDVLKWLVVAIHRDSYTTFRCVIIHAQFHGFTE